jgi:hypothetical protein
MEKNEAQLLRSSLGGDGGEQLADELAELASMATAVIFIGRKAEPKGRKGEDWRRDLGKEGRMLGFWGSVWRGKWRSRWWRDVGQAGSRSSRAVQEKTTEEDRYKVGFGVTLGWRKGADGEWMKGDAAAQIQI